jgi:hypothetical protein
MSAKPTSTSRRLQPKVAVKYRGYWYYIDDANQASKTTLALMIQLSRLDFTRRQRTGGGPFLTLPVGR